jgi:hypothetical protein
MIVENNMENTENNMETANHCHFLNADISPILSISETKEFFCNNATSISKLSDIESVLYGVNVLIDNCFLVGIKELHILPALFNQPTAAITENKTKKLSTINCTLPTVYMVYTVETNKSYKIYPRTKIDIIKMLLNKYLKNHIVLSYTETNNIKATKFNEMIFKYSIYNIPIINHEPVNLFISDYDYYHRLLNTKSEVK